MSLLDKLRSIENFPASHQPATGELLSVVGALVALAEHGEEEFFEAVERDIKAREAGEPARHVDQLVSGVEPEPEPDASASTAGAGAPDVPHASSAPAEDPQVRIAQLEQELATARAQQERTVASVTPVDEPPAAPAGPLSPAPPAAAPTTNPEGV
jgi:hypothetical protein